MAKVYTAVVNDTKTRRIISSKIKPDSVVYTDSYRSYNALNVSRFHPHRIHHSKDFAKGENYINGIENFWSQAKRILRAYNGIYKASFPLFFKKCKFRFNYGTPSPQLKILQNRCQV